MKKIVFFIMCLVITTSLFAFDIIAGGQAGLLHGSGTGSDWDDMVNQPGLANEFRLGFEMGGFWEIPVNNFFSIQPELSFVFIRAGYGGKYDVFENHPYYGPTIYTEKIAFSVLVKTLEIPVLAKVNFGPEKFKFFILAGPMLQIIIGDIEASTDIQTNSYYGDNDENQNITPDNRVIFGGALGVGFSVKTGDGKFIFDVRYRKTFTGYFDNDNTRLNVIGFRIGYGVDIEL